MFKSTASPAKLPDAVSPIYQKVLGCQLSSMEESPTSSLDLNMTDPAAALRSLLNTKQSYRSDLSLTIPSNSVLSYTPSDSISKIDNGFVLPPLAGFQSSRLESEHVFLPYQQTNSKNQRKDAILLEKQEQYNVFRSDSIHLQEKDFETMARLHTNVLSPSSDSRLSEGDQTVPHSVSPMTESPGFPLSDDGCIQATLVPPPEVLELPNNVQLKPVTVNDLQTGDPNLDNYEYCIQKVDQQLHKTAKLRGTTKTTSETREENQMEKLNNDIRLKSLTRFKILENKNNSVRIQIGRNEDCYVIENKMSKDDESMHDVVIMCDKTYDDIIDSKITCGDGRTESITLKEDKKQNQGYEGVEEDEEQKQLDEEQSEMRKYYLEADKRPTPLMVAAKNETIPYLFGDTVLHNHSTDFCNELERKEDMHKRNKRQCAKQNTPLTKMQRGYQSKFEVSSERDYCLPWKATLEKRYYLKDGTHNQNIEPGEIIHNCSDDVFRNPTASFNVSVSTLSSSTQEHTSLTKYSKIKSTIYGERSFIPNTSKYVNPTDNQITPEIYLVDYSHYATGYKNGNFFNPLPSQCEGKMHLAKNNTTWQNYSSILFPVNINNGNLYEMSEATPCIEHSLLKGRQHEGDNQKDHTASISSSSGCGCYQEESNEWLLQKINSKSEMSNKSKACIKTSPSRYSTVDSTTLESRDCSNTTKNAPKRLNGIIDKLWVSKTCFKDSSHGVDVLKSVNDKFSKDMIPVIKSANARKSENNYVRMFECSTCGFQDKEYSGIEKHIVEKHKPDGCTCDSCGETLANHCQCQGRIKISSKAITFACNICKKLCRTRFGLRRHKVKKHGSGVDIMSCLSAYQPPYTCTICSENQHTYTRYKHHMICHGVNTPFTCKTCNKAFHSKNGLALHFAKVHRL